MDSPFHSQLLSVRKIRLGPLVNILEVAVIDRQLVQHTSFGSLAENPSRQQKTPSATIRREPGGEFGALTLAMLWGKLGLFVSKQPEAWSCSPAAAVFNQS